MRKQSKVFYVLDKMKYLLSLLSFFAGIFIFMFILYYLFICFDVTRVIAGAVALFSSIHYNKEL